MAASEDVVPVPESPVYASSARRRDERESPVNDFREINERRARVENAELLRNLRSL
jgi:hypothetical protein